MKTYVVTCPVCKHDFPACVAAKWGPLMNNIDAPYVCDGCRERIWRAQLKRKADR